MASILKNLSDEQLLELNHKIRRDAESDAEVWKWAEGRLNAKAAEGKTGKTAEAGSMVVSRYRQSADYKRWLARWENQDQELKKAVALQAQRFQLLSSLVSDPDAKGMEAISKSLQARLLTLAAEASDEELVEGSGKNGWVKNVIRVIQEESKLQRQTAGEKAIAVAVDEKLDPQERERRMKEIFGIA